MYLITKRYVICFKIFIFKREYWVEKSSLLTVYNISVYMRMNINELDALFTLGVYDKD